MTLHQNERPGFQMRAIRVSKIAIAMVCTLSTLMVGAAQSGALAAEEVAIRVFLGAMPIEPQYEFSVEGEYILLNDTYAVRHIRAPEAPVFPAPDAPAEEVEKHIPSVSGRILGEALESGLDTEQGMDAVVAMLDTLPGVEVLERKGSTLTVSLSRGPFAIIPSVTYKVSPLTAQTIADRKSAWEQTILGQAEELNAATETHMLLINKGHSIFLYAPSEEDALRLRPLIEQALQGEQLDDHEFADGLRRWAAHVRDYPSDFERYTEEVPK